MDWRVTLGFGALLVAACESSTEAPPGPEPEAIPASIFGASTCGTCVKEECALSFDACKREPTCARWLGCHDACPVAEGGGVDATCVAACAAPEGSSATQARDAILACAASASPSPCAECGVNTSASVAVSILAQRCAPSTSDDACVRCEDERCCNTTNACISDSDCVALSTCYSECATPDCEASCFENHPASIVRYGRYYACTVSRCFETTDCNYAKGDPESLCIRRECAVPFAECQVEPDCLRYQPCEAQCADGDRACQLACDARFPKGKLLYETYFACIALRCLYH